MMVLYILVALVTFLLTSKIIAYNPDRFIEFGGIKLTLLIALAALFWPIFYLWLIITIIFRP